MATSPFRRRPVATRTYGSHRASAAPPTAANSTSTRTSINPTRRTSAHAPKRNALDADDSSGDSNDEADIVAASLGAKTRARQPAVAPVVAQDVDSTTRGTGASLAHYDAQMADSAPFMAQEPVARAQPARRTRSASTAAASQPQRTATSAGSTVWDETAALSTKPVAAPKRRASARLAPGTEGAGSAGERGAPRPASPAKRRSVARAAESENEVVSVPHVRATPPKKRARRSEPAPSRTAAATTKDEDDVPAPFDYVPLAERLKRSSLEQPKAEPSALAAAPQLHRTRSSSRLAGTASPPPSPAPASASATAPPGRPASPLRRTSAAAPPARPASPLRRTTSSSARAPAPTTLSAPAPAPAPAAAPRAQSKPQTAAATARPPSPAKDLSAIFSRFAPAVAEKGAGGDARDKDPPVVAAAAIKPRMMLKRSHTTGAAGGTADEAADPAAAPASPARRALDRTLSQPMLGSSPLASPARAGAALGASLSFPSLGSPSRAGGGGASPNPFSREASPSPTRPTPRAMMSGPALGSAYRPLAFAAPSAAAFVTAAAPTRTYAGGARTLRRDADEEALFAAPAPSSSASAASSTPSSSALPKLPPSLSRRTRAPGTGVTGAPRQPQQDLSTLRALWGIDAEDALADLEEADSQDRGARVVGGGLLRKQGEGKRWMDEMGWCLEGLREGERSAARASALDLLNKLLSRDWLRRLKSSGQAETVYLAFRIATSSPLGGPDAPAGPDRVLDTAFATLLALLVRDQRMAEPLFRLRAADVAREAARRQSAQDGDDDGASQGAPTFAAQGGDAALRSEASAGWWSSSPRKAGAAGDDGVDEDRCDLLEVLRELGEREWVGEPIGVATGGAEAEGAAKGKGKKVLKGDARHLHSLRDIIASADLLPASDDPTVPSQPVTVRALVLASTRSIASFAPRTVFQPQQLLCESGVFEQVVQVFADECCAVQERVTKYGKGLDLLPPGDVAAGSTISLSTLSTCLAIFESTSLATPYAFHLISSPSVLPSLARALEDLTLLAFLLALDAPASAAADSTRTESVGALTAVLGILFGLTTESVWGVPLVAEGSDLVHTLVRTVLACRRVAANERASITAGGGSALSRGQKPRAASLPLSEGDVEMKRSDSDDRDDNGESAGDHAVWDVLSLALGVLANLAESADEDLRVRVRELRLDSSCHGHRKCARESHCVSGDDEQASALEILARLALDPLDDAPNSVYHHSITGFLRLLLGLLVLDSPQNEELVLAALSSSPSALAPVLDALEELASLHDDERRARDEMALPAPPDDTPRDDNAGGGETQRTEVDETQLADEEVKMGEIGTARGAGSEEGGEGLPRRMRELVQRLRRRIAP